MGDTCILCRMAVVDDLHRDEDGDLWHGECYAKWCDEYETAYLDVTTDQHFRHEAAIDRELRRRPDREDSSGGDSDE